MFKRFHLIFAVVLSVSALLPANAQAQGGLLERLGDGLGLLNILSPITEPLGLDVRGVLVALDSGLQSQPLVAVLLPAGDNLGMSNVAMLQLQAMDEPASTSVASPTLQAMDGQGGAGDQPALQSPQHLLADYRGAAISNTPRCRDEDADGVCDTEDQCAYTPPRTAVLANGCTLLGVAPLLESVVFFDLDSSEIPPSFTPMLDKFAGFMLARSNRKLAVRGYADASGNDSHNIALSEARAEAVIHYLVRQGVPPWRLSARGYGASAATQPGEDTQARRVELELITE